MKKLLYIIPIFFLLMTMGMAAVAVDGIIQGDNGTAALYTIYMFGYGFFFVLSLGYAQYKNE